ncbi:MAG: hypothetical protein NTU46_01225 [Burkholderiales bacterium]|nr:hypothetical protein [Burkholderiales bacterium]
MRKTFDPTQLTQFIGTTAYYRISRRHLLTDGTKYLAEEAECFWMMIEFSCKFAYAHTACEQRFLKKKSA